MPKNNYVVPPGPDIPVASPEQIAELRSRKRFTLIQTEMLQTVLCHPALTAIDKTVYAYLHTIASHDTLIVLRSKQRLASDLGVSVSTITRSLRTLRVHGFLDVRATTYRDSAGATRQGFNRVRLTLPAMTAKSLLTSLPDRRTPAATRGDAAKPPIASSRGRHAATAASFEPPENHQNGRALDALTKLRAACGYSRSRPVDRSVARTTPDTDLGVNRGTQNTQQSETPHHKQSPARQVTADSAVPLPTQALLSDGLNTVSWCLTSRYQAYVRRRLKDCGIDSQHASNLLDQFEYQLRKGFMADRDTRHAVNVLLKLVRVGQYRTPRGYQTQVYC